MATRSYLSIGEVLVALKAEFPDITISKIRFLEGEGLIDPERTPSGYRKFYDKDVDRLRRILRLQRDEYLPLKVIRERLDSPVRESSARGGDDEPGPEPEAGTAPAARRELPPLEDDIVQTAQGLQMSIEELSSATGVDADLIRELESFGLLKGQGDNGARYYDGDDLVVLSIVKDFFKYGVEPRHLTMYRHFAEREASFFEAIVLPVLRQRNPDARKAATESLGDLARLSRKLKQALLSSNLRQHLTGAP
ncbi:MAG: MerR family transcriptional regulator [Actinomycetota bacterium]